MHSCVILCACTVHMITYASGRERGCVPHSYLARFLIPRFSYLRTSYLMPGKLLPHACEAHSSTCSENEAHSYLMPHASGRLPKQLPGPGSRSGYLPSSYLLPGPGNRFCYLSQVAAFLPGYLRSSFLMPQAGCRNSYLTQPAKRSSFLPHASCLQA